MRKQITFEEDGKAIDWLLNLSKCFYIKNAKIKRIPNKKYETYDWRLIVEYE